jgi:hypothetical protein
VFHNGITRLLITENKCHAWIQIAETIYDDGKWVSVMAFGENFSNMIDNMNFGGTLQIKHFLNIPIKVYADEIYSTIGKLVHRRY